MTNSLTGIPIEVLFGAVGTLVLLLYGDLRWTLRKLTNESVKRGKQLVIFRVYLKQLCEKAGILFDDKDD